MHADTHYIGEGLLHYQFCLLLTYTILYLEDNTHFFWMGYFPLEDFSLNSEVSGDELT